ncbi:hypothetical protein ANN_05229 [Periplaneta americana]|uniref:Uncharacterized protein n=1 Tax=Periplaneta americana TaxID=6978 RepID=A0ABQ8TBT7_PERAM|nr:hypothetical protein ANN_05229 [Periplaneta americana]
MKRTENDTKTKVDAKKVKMIMTREKKEESVNTVSAVRRKRTRRRIRNPVAKASYNGWEDHRANHTIPPFWLDDRPPLLRHVGVRPAAGWSV